MLPTGKKPIPLAPAPARFGAVRPRLAEPELSSSSGEEEELVSRTTGIYAELEGFEADDVEEEPVEDEAREELVRARVAASQEQMHGILAGLTQEQLLRYETFRRIGFARPQIKRVVQRVLDGLGKEKGAVMNQSAPIIVAGIAKVFVGELVEEARAVMEQWEEPEGSAIMPTHILEAQRRLKARGIVPGSANHRKRNGML